MMADLGLERGASRIDLAETEDFELGGLHVSPAHRQVHRNGERRELEPRVAQVLVALADARPGVISRERLIERCWEGRIVGDDAINRCIVALRHLAKEFSPEPFAIETVARVGYCLIESPGSEQKPAPAASVGAGSGKLAIAALLALILISAMLAVGWSRYGRAEADPASIAVLPFRNLSNGDSYFAEGIGEEIMGQLAREPAFRVAGSASAAQFTGPSDPREVGRTLGVDYILEGSVRSDAGRLRINASLVKTSDGMRLWSETYDRKLEDILEVQIAIGQAVASGLSRSLVHAPGRRAVNGEAYALYLNARGLVRSGNPEAGEDAIGLLRQAIRLDPGLAPAWANLADALHLHGKTKGADGLIAVLPEAHKAARQALKLDPNLPEAHGVMAMLLGNDSPEAMVHLNRAAELEPRTGQGQIWRGMTHFVAGEYADGMTAYRRAQELDPIWLAPPRILTNLYIWFGDGPATEEAVKKAFPDDPPGQHHGLARAAAMRGDYSEAARRWSIVASETSSRWSSPAKLSLEDLKYLLKLSSDLPSRPVRPMVGQFREGPRVWMSAAPSPAAWQKSNRSFAAALVNHDVNIVSAKRMLLAGRAAELVATYDRPWGLLYMRPGVRVGVCDLHEAALVALALRDSGRSGEADALLRESDALMQTVYRRGKVPRWFDEDAAALWAVQGKTGPALDALERAMRRGAMHSGRTDLSNLEEEPAFRSLRGNPRFKALIARHKAHFAREREETARLLNIPV